MMKEIKTDFCKINFYNRYAIISFDRDILLTLPKAKEVRNKFREYYGTKDFVLITHREHPHRVAKEVYEQGQLRNMKGLAIVSKHKEQKDQAIREQRLFNKSFVFFETLEEAVSWAEMYFLD